MLGRVHGFRGWFRNRSGTRTRCICNNCDSLRECMDFGAGLGNGPGRDRARADVRPGLWVGGCVRGGGGQSASMSLSAIESSWR